MPRPTAAARKDSAVHVSLSSYSLVKQPGSLLTPPRAPPGAGETPCIRRPSDAWFTVPVRSFTGALSRRRRTARRRAYIGFAPAHCQLRSGRHARPEGLFSESDDDAGDDDGGAPVGRRSARRAALRPYSCFVLAPQVEGWNRSLAGAIRTLRFPIVQVADPSAAIDGGMIKRHRSTRGSGSAATRGLRLRYAAFDDVAQGTRAWSIHGRTAPTDRS